MTYQIGQILPPAQPPSQPFGQQCPPAWYCFHPRPDRASHEAGRQFFRDHGMFAFYPSEERTRAATGPRKRVTVEVPMVPGYLFAQCLREPAWHVLKGQPWLSNVFKVGDTPIIFPYAVIRHLQGLTVDAERLARAREQLRQAMIDASRPVEGEQARFVSGPFAGQTVTVESVVGQVAYFELLGKRIVADTANMRRL